MKNYFIYAAMLITLGIKAQDFRGQAVYESKTVLELGDSPQRAGHEMDDELKASLAKALEKTYTLNFDRTASIYEEEEKLAPPSPGKHSLVVKMPGAGKRYKDIRQKTYMVEADVFDKEFLIADALPQFEWKMDGESKKIGNYTCYKATAVIKPIAHPVESKEKKDGNKTVSILGYSDKEKVITAWYTPDIPVSHGPADYWGLPGLILEVSDGRTILLCSKVVLNPKTKTEIKPLIKGEKVTQKEYDSILQKKTQEVFEMQDKESMMIIKTD